MSGDPTCPHGRPYPAMCPWCNGINNMQTKENIFTSADIPKRLWEHQLPERLRLGWEDEQRLREVVPQLIEEKIVGRVINIKVLSKLFDDLDEARKRTAELEQSDEEWQDATGLVGVHASGLEGDPGSIKPRHLHEELTLARAVIEAARECSEPGWCITEPDCGNCPACRLQLRLRAFDRGMEPGHE